MDIYLGLFFTNLSIASPQTLWKFNINALEYSLKYQYYLLTSDVLCGCATSMNLFCALMLVKGAYLALLRGPLFLFVSPHHIIKLKEIRLKLLLSNVYVLNLLAYVFMLKGSRCILFNTFFSHWLRHY